MTDYSIKKLVEPTLILGSLALMHALNTYLTDSFFLPLPGIFIAFMFIPLVLEETPDPFMQTLETVAITLSAWVVLTPAAAVQVTLMALAAAAACGYVSHRHYVRISAIKKEAEINQGAADTMEALNGNIERVKECRDRLLTILRNPSAPLSPEISDELRVVVHTLNNLELATNGWRALKKFIQEIDIARERQKAVDGPTTPTSPFASS